MDDVQVGTLVSREAPFARNKGFGEREDKNLQSPGITVSDVGTGTSLLYDVRALYGFFLWLNNISAEDITFTLLYTFKNFTDITALTGDEDWQAALDSGNNPITGTITAGTEQEIIEFVRATSRVSGVRIDFNPPPSAVVIQGAFSAV